MNLKSSWWRTIICMCESSQYKGEQEKTVDTGEATFWVKIFKNDRSCPVKLEYFVSEQM